MSETSKFKYMHDSFELVGTWFLPSQYIDDSIKGVLKYSPQEIVLEVFDSFPAEDDEEIIDFLPNLTDHELIFGVTQQGENVSLHGCVQISSSTSTGGFSYSKYIPDFMFVGGNFVESMDDKEFEKLSVSFTFLDAWAEYPIYTYKSVMDGKTRENHGYYHSRKEANQNLKSVELDGGLLISEGYIRREHSQAKDLFVDETIQLITTRTIEIRNKDFSALNCSELKTVGLKLRNLYTLLVGYPLYFKFLEFVFHSKSTKSLPNYEKVKLFFKQPGDMLDYKKRNPPSRQTVLISRGEILGNFESLFQNWFRKENLLTPIVDSYIGDMYLNTFLETKLLNSIRDIEVFHRNFLEEKESLSDEERIEREKAIRFIHNSISDSYKAPFCEKISYDNGVTLRRRLLDVFALLPKQMLLGIIKTPKSRKAIHSYIQSIVETRNFYTHHDDEENYSHLIPREKLYVTHRCLKAITIFLIFRELGIDETLIEEKILNSNSYRHIFS